jgi:hypothetical protein
LIQYIEVFNFYKIRKKAALIAILTIFCFIIITSFSTFLIKQNSTNRNELGQIRSARTVTHSNDLWVVNPTFEEPVTEWYYTVDGDTSDAATSFSPNEANLDIIGETYETQVLLNNDTKSNWQAFNKSDLVVIPTHPLGGGVYTPTYGIDDEGCWASHYWQEEQDDGQPKNTPRMNWKTNVSLGVDMSDYIIKDVSFEAVINASVWADIDTEGDTIARGTTTPINQHETYDYVQFYVEISTILIGSRLIKPECWGMKPSHYMI